MFLICVYPSFPPDLPLSSEVYAGGYEAGFLISGKLHVWIQEVREFFHHCAKQDDHIQLTLLTNINPINPKLQSIPHKCCWFPCISVPPLLDLMNTRYRNLILALQHLWAFCSLNSHEVMTSLRVVKHPATARFNSCIWSPWYGSPRWGWRKSQGYFRVTAA